jgi:carbamoyl-phosphate synthase small subunit
MQAILALEDGRIFRGKGFGAPVEAAGEVVFNTSLTGYQEIFTDPSYAGQIVVLTNPHMGNYGTTPSDAEAVRPYIEGLVTREFSQMSSNWRSTEVADDFLERSGIPVIAEVDTRAVVRHLRTNGVMRGVIASGENLDPDALVARARSIRKMEGTDLASVVTTKAAYPWDASEPKNQTGDEFLPGTDEATDGEPLHVVAYDFGIKQNILRMLTRENCRVTVVPAKTTAEETLALNPDGVFFSNGPGDPEPLDYAIETVQQAAGQEADLRDLPGAPDLRAGAGRQDLQAEVRTPRRQPPHPEPSHRQGGDHGAEPQLQRRSGVAAGGCGAHAHESERPHAGRACGTRPTRCSACSTIPRPAPDRMIRIICSGIFAR